MTFPCKHVEEKEPCPVSSYRVFKDGKQIASTVATSLPVPDTQQEDVSLFEVKSVDKWGNMRK